MATINGVSYQDPRNINLKGMNSIKGSVLRFARTSSSSPLDSSSNGLYVNSSNQLVFAAQGVLTILGAAGAGGGSAPSWDAIYAGDQLLAVSGTTLTFDGTHASNNVITLTDSAAGSGHLLQITNTGTGKDVNGTSGLWSFSKAGAGVALSMALAGTSGANSFTMTTGDILMSDGSITVIDADDAASLSVTNNTAATASLIVFAGSGTFTGSTTTSFMTITPSGMTTGTALYMPVAALTTGRGMHIVANAVTSGIVFNVTSSATAITGAGRLFLSTHSGATGTSAILNEFISAANDETVILQVTASAALATGTAFAISASSMTTGNGITLANLDALTTGLGAQIASAATAITGNGRMLFVNHTGATSSTGTLVEFKTAATDAVNATTLLKLSSAASIVGINLSIVGTTGMTTGSLIRATSSTAGAVATNGIYSFLLTGAFTSGASTLGAFHVAGASTVTGTIMSILGGAQTTGIALNITDPSTGMTSGSLLRVISATAGAVATNGIVSLQSSGVFTSTTIGFVNVIVSGAVAGTGMAIQMSATSQTTGIGLRVDQTNTTTGYSGALVQFTGSHTTGGTTLSVVDVTTTTGDGVLISSNALVAGTSTAMRIAHTTSVLGAGNSLLRLSSTSVDTGTTTGTLLDLASTATTGTVALVTASALTSGIALSIVSSGASQTTATALSITQTTTATGFTGSLVSILGSSTTGSGNALLVTGVNTTAGDVVKIVSNAVTLGAATLLNLSHTTSVLGAGSSMARITSTSIDTGTTTGVLLDLAATAATTATLVLLTSATITSGSGMVFNMNGLTTGVGFSIAHTTSVIASGGSLLRLNSTSVDTGTTTGTLLDLGATAATTGTMVLGTFAALTTGIGMSLVDSSSNASARQVAKFSVTNTAAVLSEPIRTSNVAVSNSKFTKHIVMTDGTKVTTIWISQDATSPNTVLSGIVGDICLNGPSGRSFYCTGTTNWTASNA